MVTWRGSSDSVGCGVAGELVETGIVMFFVLGGGCMDLCFEVLYLYVSLLCTFLFLKLHSKR